jgi:hypothetical protein
MERFRSRLCTSHPIRFLLVMVIMMLADGGDQCLSPLPRIEDLWPSFRFAQNLGFGIRYIGLCGLYPFPEVGILRDQG